MWHHYSWWLHRVNHIRQNTGIGSDKERAVIYVLHLVPSIIIRLLFDTHCELHNDQSMSKVFSPWNRLATCRIRSWSHCWIQWIKFDSEVMLFLHEHFPIFQIVFMCECHRQMDREKNENISSRGLKQKNTFKMKIYSILVLRTCSHFKDMERCRLNQFSCFILLLSDWEYSFYSTSKFCIWKWNELIVSNNFVSRETRLSPYTFQ